MLIYRSCEDIRSVDEFENFIEFRANALRMGLDETARILCWDAKNLISLELFKNLYEGKTFTK